MNIHDPFSLKVICWSHKYSCSLVIGFPWNLLIQWVHSSWNLRLIGWAISKQSMGHNFVVETWEFWIVLVDMGWIVLFYLVFGRLYFGMLISHLNGPQQNQLMPLLCWQCETSVDEIIWDSRSYEDNCTVALGWYGIGNRVEYSENDLMISSFCSVFCIVLVYSAFLRLCRLGLDMMGLVR